MARRKGALGGLAALAVVVASCSGKTLPAGGVMVVFSSDMSIPKDVSSLHIEISQTGVTLFANDYQIGPSPLQTIPATLLILPPPDKTEPVQVRLTAIQGTKPRILRDSIVVVPT